MEAVMSSLSVRSAVQAGFDDPSAKFTDYPGAYVRALGYLFAACLLFILFRVSTIWNTVTKTVALANLGVATGVTLAHSNMLLAIPHAPWPIVPQLGSGIFLIQDGSTTSNGTAGVYDQEILRVNGTSGDGRVQYVNTAALGLPPITPGFDGHFPSPVIPYDSSSSTSHGQWGPIITDDTGINFPFYWLWWKDLPLGSAIPNAEPNGVGIMALSVMSVSAFIQTIHISPNAVLSLWEGDGRMVAASIDGVTQNGFARYQAIACPDDRISQAASYLFRVYPTLDVPDLFAGSYTGSGQISGKIVVGTRWITDSYGLKWLLVVVVPMKDFRGSYDQVKTRVIGVIAGTSVVLVILSGLLAYTLVTPIRRLTEMMVQATSFDFSAVKKGTLQENGLLVPREIVQCKQVFHTMLLKFSDAIQKNKSLQQRAATGSKNQSVAVTSVVASASIGAPEEV
ncbi:hypothetical protein BDZ88DRAFT_410952 [Geranomyces variabilis]|nr:hypothetical protein BDZ88DRAFT_410952 [Geranomyces variabilis]